MTNYNISISRIKGSADCPTDVLKTKKDMFISVAIPLKPGNPLNNGDKTSTYERYVKVFKGGTPEEYCHHRATMEELYKKLQYDYFSDHEDDPTLCYDIDGKEVVRTKRADHMTRKQVSLFISTLGGTALETFEAEWHKHDDMTHTTKNKKGDEVTVRSWYASEAFKIGMNAIALDCFTHAADSAKSQARYLREGGLLFCGQYTRPKDFFMRLELVNKYLKYFPHRKKDLTLVEPNSLSDDDLLDILDKARPTNICLMMISHNDHSRKYLTAASYAAKLEEWHENGELQRLLEQKDKSSKRGADDDSDSRPAKKRKKKPKETPDKKKRTVACVHCSKYHWASDDQCRFNPKNKKKGDKEKEKGKHGEKRRAKEFDKAVSRQVAKEVKKATSDLKKEFKKKFQKTRFIDDSDDEKTDDEKADGFASRLRVDLTNSSDDDSTSVKSSYLGVHSSIDSTLSDAITKITLDGTPETDKHSDDISAQSGTVATNSKLATNKENADTPYIPSVYAFYENSHKRKKQKKTHYTAEIIVEIEDRKGDRVPIRCLLDTGCSDSILLRDYVKRGRAKSFKGKPTVWDTMGGKFVTKQKALIDFKFPELDYNKSITHICHIDSKTDKKKALYDMIIGMDLMTEIGIYVNTETKNVCWQGANIPLRQRGVLQNKDNLSAIYSTTINPVLHEAEERQSRILDADYSGIDIATFCEELEHLNLEERQMLSDTLEAYPTLFGGGLGRLNIKPIDLELKPDATPYSARPFPIPQSLHKTTKKEIDRLRSIKVFEANSDSEWAAPTFVQKKKTGDVRILTDFRKLNDCIKRKPFPLPRISDLLQKLRNFKYATAIDLSMGYYHIPLSKEAQKLCTTVLPWGKYRYKVLPMGIKNTPDIFQEIMNNMFCDLEFTSAYLDDILVISDGTFEDHMQKIQQVLDRLEKANFRANVRKCFFAKDSIEYLGYQISRQGIQPQPKKVEAIQKLKPPKNVRQLRHFLGMVNYYRDMWQRRSHVLAPLTKLVGKKTPFKWEAEQQKAFDEIKRIMAKETILAYPDFSKPFHIYTDASNTQLGAVIMQEDKPLAFYSRKLNSAQKNYTTGEQELLSIVETLKEFRSLLWGQDLIVHTDHMNIVYGNLSNDRITRWRLLLEEYAPKFVHVKGKDNVVADALSRLDKASEPSEQERKARADPEEESNAKGQYMAYVMTTSEQDHSVFIPDAEDPLQMAQCYAKKRDLDLEKFPMHPELIAKYQLKDRQCQRYQKHKEFRKRTIEGTKILTFNNKIVIPRLLQERIMAWYHLYLRHPGATRMEKTLNVAFWWEGLRKDVEQFVRTCHECQLNKKVRKQYGKLPAKTAEDAIPWKRVNIDLIGPLSVNTPSGTFKLDALTMIDPATGWFELKEVRERTANIVAQSFDDAWLSRYPRPQEIGFDNGGENKGLFNTLIENYGMKRKPTTTYNPQANGIVERVHAVLNDILRTFELEERDLDPHDPFSEFLSAAAFAIRATYHTTLQATPAQLVFGRDMILPVAITANWGRIKERRQEEINRNNARENRGRVPHEYHVGDKVLLKKEGILRKLASPRDGPHTVTRVYNNGTVQLQHGAINERINIRRIIPYLER